MAQGRGPITGSINRRQSRFKTTGSTVLHNRRRRHPAKAGLIESMSRPIVAIVGRPNVGKSTLFNRVLGWRKAIVDPQSGLTRDRLYGIAEWRGREFSIVDTAGLHLDWGKHAWPAALLAPAEELAVATKAARLAIMGRPNVGKSSLLNALLGDERALVSPLPGTTRDPVDTELVYDGVPVVLVDTAGIRRKSTARDRLEQYSLLRGMHAMERADAVLLVLDASAGVLAQDQHVARYALEAGKGLVIVANKINLVEPAHLKAAYLPTALLTTFKFAPFAPIVTVSAKTKEGIRSVIPSALEVVGQRRIKIPPNELNRVLRQAFVEHPPPSYKGRRLRLGYATHVAAEAPNGVV